MNIEYKEKKKLKKTVIVNLKVLVINNHHGNDYIENSLFALIYHAAFGIQCLLIN